MATVDGFKITKRTRSGFDKMYVDDLSDETLASMAKQALTRPSESMWFDDDMYSTHTQMFPTVDPDLSDDDLVGLSNYQSVGEALRAVWPNGAADSSFGHWTYSRFLALKIRVLRGDGSSREITPVFAAACSIALALRERNPLFDDDHYSSLESAKWDEVDTETVADLRRELADEDSPYALSDADLELFIDDVMEHLHDIDGQGYRSEYCYGDDSIAAAKERAASRIGMVRHAWNDQALF